MGTSTDATLWYGYVSTEEDTFPGEVPEEESDDIEGWANTAMKPWRVVVIRHCSAECPMYGIAIAESVQLAWRGNPVGAATPPAAADWESRLKAAADAVGWTERDSGWFLASDWG